MYMWICCISFSAIYKEEDKQSIKKYFSAYIYINKIFAAIESIILNL